MSATDTEYQQPEEDFWAEGPKSFSFDGAPPITCDGVVLKQEKALQTDIQTREVKPPWPSGNPRYKVVITLQGEPEDAEDDGMRLLHVDIPSARYAAIKDAIKEAGQKTLYNGDRLTLTYVKDGPKEKGKSPKIWEGLVTPFSTTA